MVDEQAHREVRAAVRWWLGPPAALLRGRVRVLAAHLADGEAVEAVVAATTPRPFSPTDLVAATDRRLVVVGRWGRIRSLPWTDVRGVEFGPRGGVVRTPDRDLVLTRALPELGLRRLAERAGGDPGPVAGACAVLLAVLGRSAWQFQEGLVRVLDELEPGEAVVDLLEAGIGPGLVVLTDGRVGLVPSRQRRPSAWVALARVRRVDVRDRHVVVADADGAVFGSEVGPPDRVRAFADRVAARSGAVLVADDRTGDDDERDERDESEDGWDEDGPEANGWEEYGCAGEWDEDDGGDAAGGWPTPPDDETARRLAAFAADLADRLEGVAVVRREFPGSVTLLPASPAAAVLSWADSGHGLLLEIDWGRGGVLELGRGAVPELEAAVRAVVAGRLVAGWRGRTVISLPDGREVRTRRPYGERPVRGRRRRFLAYAFDVDARLSAGRDPLSGA